MSISEWKKIREEHVVDMGIFDVRRAYALSPRTGSERRLARITTGDWVNVVAVTPGLDVVLVRQYRHGTEAVTLEIPGGLVDPDESPEEAAVRELREETGYTGSSVTPVGVVEPNPAFLNNRCHTYLVEGCRPTHDLELDVGEDIQVVRRPLREIPGAIRAGEIAHALVVCGFWWTALLRPDLLVLNP